jgi:hypothetical protein
MEHKEVVTGIDCSLAASTGVILLINRQKSAEGIVVNARSNVRFMAKA